MKKVKIGKIKTVYRGILFDIKQQKLKFPNGSQQTYEYCYRDDSVLVLPFNKKGELLMIREYRSSHNREVWFLPAGRMDKKGETAKFAAQRELREEAGYRAKKIKLFSRRYPSGHAVYNVFVYVAQDLIVDPLKGDEHFPIKVVPVSLSKAVTMALDGTIQNEFIAFNIVRFAWALKHKKFHW